MATIVLGAAGAALGSAVGGTVLGLSSAVIGRAIGATLGRAVDARIMGQGADPVETGKVDRFRLTGASEGLPVPHIYGAYRVAGQVIWASDFLESHSTSGGGKGAPKGPAVTEFSYSVSVAIALCEGEIGGVGRIWADGSEIAADSINMRVYTGREDQTHDPAIEAIEGSGNAPSYRGIAYVVLEGLELGDYGNRIPQLSFEVLRPERSLPGDIPGGISGAVVSAAETLAEGTQGVALIPGTGEYSLATSPVTYSEGPGLTRSANVHTPTAMTDFASSVSALESGLPACKSASLVVSWFGNDLRMDQCEIKPKVEQNETDGVEMPWHVSGELRSGAGVTPQEDGRSVYGGTPTDQSVVEAIKHLKDTGQDVVFYPFILMEQLDGNSRSDPWSEAVDQPRLPWRGRITGTKAPGQPGTNDGTSAADTEVEAFFGSASPADFSISEMEASSVPFLGSDFVFPPSGSAAGTTVIDYAGPQEWSYRRFILHYASLCAAAGGVDAFCIGSEMRGLTQYRGPGDSFPAVDALIALAADVRSILGPDTKIGYAADWSEYFGYHPDDGSGDVYFHLDPLWMNENIDFIGIDNYMSIADWRDGDDHLDAAYGSIYNIDYLRANIAGGEGFDWYYHSPEARDAQIRTAITDSQENEPWIFRYKDLKSWWTKLHYNRTGGGIRETLPNIWEPGAKPIWFTEYGCAAIDKSANQPNRFVDPKSSESALPYYSDGSRDELMQRMYLGAFQSYWADQENNPTDENSGHQMVDMSHAHAWAWDARPFPWYPGNSDVWSDARNYHRGHWLNGREAGWTLAGVVREICARSGVTEIDVSELRGYVRGYVDNGGSNARAALQPLMLAYGFDAIEREGILQFRMRDGKPAGELHSDVLAIDEEADWRVQTTRASEAEIAGRLRLNHLEFGGDYAAKTVEAIFPDEVSYMVSQNELPLVLTKNESRAIVERWLAESRIARDTIRFALPPSQLPLGAGDVLGLHDEKGSNALYRIDYVEQSGIQTVDATRVEAGAYSPGDSSDESAALRPFLPPVPVWPVFLDLPLIDETDTAHAPWIAVAAKPWPGSIAVFSSTTDYSYTANTHLNQTATFGLTENAMLRAASGLKDRSSRLRVRLSTGALSSASWSDILTGANLAAIGDGTAGNWELFQFESAVLTGPETWELRGLLRGQKGSDGLIPDDWSLGSQFVLLNGAPKQISLPAELRGIERHYRIGTPSRPLDDSSYLHLIAGFEGNGLRPYSPVHLKAKESETGDIKITWIRRTRADGDSWQGTDVPLAEESEIYAIRIIKNGVLLREANSSVAEFVYTQAMQTSDGAVDPLTIEVAQISALYGLGLPGELRFVKT